MIIYVYTYACIHMRYMSLAWAGPGSPHPPCAPSAAPPQPWPMQRICFVYGYICIYIYIYIYMIYYSKLCYILLYHRIVSYIILFRQVCNVFIEGTSMEGSTIGIAGASTSTIPAGYV